MAALTFDGLAVAVALQGAAEREPERGGESVRAFDGTLRSTVRWEKKAWAFVTAPLTPLQADALRESWALGQFVEVGGDAVSALGETFLCEVRVTEVSYTLAAGAGTGAGQQRRRLALAIREV